MKVVVRNRSYHKAHLYARGVQKEFYSYEGELIATPKWVEYPAITMTIPDQIGLNKKYAFRIIPREDIVSIDGEDIKIDTKPVSKVKEIKVTGSKGDTYIVTLDGKRSSCTCHAFQFRRSCKHIKQVMETI
jgi:hypothetical protein